MKISKLAVLSLIMLMSACSDDPATTPTPNDGNGDDNKEEPVPSKNEMLIGNWTIKVATFNGNTDGSNTGDKIQFKSNGFYTKESLSGEWMWKNDSTGLTTDYGKQHEADWTILKLNEDTLNIDLYFKGNPGKFHWEMLKDK